MKFTLQQFAESAVARQNNIDNTIPEKQRNRIQEFINKLLNPLANAYGKDILVSSGYRCPELNKLFGNDPNASSHGEGYGVDLVPADGAIDEFKDFVAKWIKNKSFDQYIDESNDSNKWVHITYKSSNGKQRKQGLKTQNNKCGKIDLSKHSATAAANPQPTTTNSADPIQKNAKLSKGEAAKKEKIAMDYLTSHGMSIYGAAGVCGCMTYECGFNANVYNKLEYSGKGVNNQYITTRGWHCGEGLIGITDFKYKVKLIKGCQWDTRFGIPNTQAEYLKNSSKHIYELPFEVQLEGLVENYRMNGKLGEMASASNYRDGIVSAYKCIAGGGITDWNSAVAVGQRYVDTHTRQAREAGSNRVYYNGFLLRAETTRRILERYQSGSTNGDAPVSMGSGGGGGSYSSGGSSYGGSSNSGSKDTRQYRDINVMSIRTGGSTQTGSTEGLLTGKSIYLKMEISEDEVKNNGVYTKDENGEIVKDQNGNPVPNDNYVFNEVEIENQVENSEELPDITTPEQKEETEKKDDGTKKIGSTVDKEAIKKEANMTDDQKKKAKKEKIKKSKKKWKNKFKDMDKEEAKAKLMDWLSEQPIMLQNAFHILIIKDTIDQIKTFIEQLKNTSIENQMDLLNSINDILAIFEMLGLTPDAKGITMQDLKDLGLAAAGTVAETAKNIGDQVQQNSDAYTQEQINAANAEYAAQGGMVLSNNVIADAKGTVAGITGKVNTFQGMEDQANATAGGIGNTMSGVTDRSLNGGSFDMGTSNTGSVAANTAKSVGVDIATSMTSQVANNFVDAGMNLDMNAIANGDIPTINSNGAFTYKQSTNEKNINIDITISKNPSLHLMSITSFIKSFRDAKGKDIFNNGATKQIKEGFKEAWELNDTVDLKIQAIVDGVTKFYIFTFTVDQAARKKTESTGNSQTESTDLFAKMEDDANGVGDKFSNMGSDIENKANQFGTDAKNKAEGFGDAAQDKAMEAGDKAMSQLTKVNININADMIESVLAGKVLMFDEVVQFLKILQPIIETLKFIAHLLENYIINKEFVRTKQRVDLAKALRDAAQLVNGLKDLFSLKDTNFFTIRTKEMSDWAINTYKRMPNEQGYLVIGQIDSAADVLSMVTANNADTVKLNTYCAMHGINPDCPLDLLKGTTLYFDKWSIDHGGHKDGTSNGLDNIEINRDLGEIYYDKLNRSTISSEILRARKKNVDPYEDDEDYGAEELSNEIDYKSILDAISFESDEFEGTQTLNIGDLDLCSPTVKDRDKNQGGNKNGGNNGNNGNEGESHSVILEFGDEYTLGKRVDGHFTVKPGQTINEGDYIGFIRKDGKDVSIKTEYTGIVRSADQNNTDYYRVYPSFTTKQRHIIIDNPTKCSATTYDIKDVMNLQKSFKKATELEALITNCMPLSILPSMLKNATRYSLTSKSYDAFNQMIRSYDIYVNDCADRMKKQAEDLKENANMDSINKMKDDMFQSKIDLIQYAITTYRISTNENYKVSGDNRYIDCAGLGYNSSKEFKRYGKDDTLEYGNYYLNLLKSIPQSTKMSMPVIDMKATDISEKMEKLLDPSINEIGKKINNPAFSNFGKDLMQALSGAVDNMGKINEEDEEPSKIDEFRDIVKNIIDIRLAYEGRNASNMISIFNSYCKGYTHMQNYYQFLQNEIKDGKINIDDSQSILSQIKKDMRYNDGDNSELFDVCQQALTLFMYICNADITTDVRKTETLYGKQKTYKKQTISDAIVDVSETYISEQKPKEYTSTSLNDTSTYTSFNDLYDIVYKDKLYDAQKNTMPPMTIQTDEVEQNTVNTLSSLLEVEEEIVKHLINARSGEKGLSTNSKLFFKDVAENSMYYKMVQDEAAKLEEFWEGVIDEYKVCNTSTAVEELSTYAHNLNTNVVWPQSLNIKIDKANYELYTFIDPYEADKDIPEVDIPYKEYEIDDNKLQVDTPDASINLEDNRDIRQNSPITIFDYEYWLVYMLNATLFTLIPSFWADGFDIPPFMIPLLLPAIYMPIAPPVMIPMVNVLMVFGIALRGMWPAPIILMINLSSDDIDVLIFLKIALEIAKDIFKKIQETVENTIPNMVNMMLQNYLSENEIAQKAIEKFRIYSSIIKAIPAKDKALIEKKFNDALEDELNKPNKLTEAQSKLDNASRKIEEARADAMNSINQGFNDMNQRANAYTQEGIEEQEVYFNGTTEEKIAYYQAKKEKRDKKKYDRRQVVTREADLGSGTPPM